MTDTPAGRQEQDAFLADCVICGRPAIECCLVGDRRNHGTVRDFCADCIEAGEDADNFGRCYVCRDFHDHDHCIGVPCQCPCPTPDQRQMAALREQAIGKLTLDEQRALGVV